MPGTINLKIPKSRYITVKFQNTRKKKKKLQAWGGGARCGSQHGSGRDFFKKIKVIKSLWVNVSEHIEQRQVAEKESDILGGA